MKTKFLIIIPMVMAIFWSISGCQKPTGELAPTDLAGEKLAKKAIVNATDTTVKTFSKEPVANAAVVAKKFKFPSSSTDVKKILMHVYLTCPSGGCPPWDVYANVRLMKSNGDDNKTYGYELGRWITPYGKDNTSIPGGWVIDVTDFRSLLIGDVTLETRAEVWSGTWEVSIDFEFQRGTPTYKYSAVVPIMQYNDWSWTGINFGKGTVTANNYNGKQTGFNISGMPSNVERTSFRSIISGWGQAYPAAPGGRRFAEWAFRKHGISIDDSPTFVHDMNGLGCAVNPKVVKNQAGNWTPDRAGWCPGLEVPVRTNVLASPKAGGSFNFNYVLQEDQWNPNNLTEKWRDNGVDTGGAYYALSTYMIIESNSPISGSPVVSNRP
ncbi:peptide-N-glycosidase F-related protein [Sphingobacterium detergens]|uniref:Peptide-N-glycosidase F-like protein n=1 Tax=Sphingobacterium detergens TaxID=1145106 RepID=A0A420B6G6_SPHD1|nr:peptide-N-glycosidase F-related protein [Sphingobacterium detergens]RKE52291.1 peptide-N-glycosidase F-like protein [Sphingobacterium detergens]